MSVRRVYVCTYMVYVGQTSVYMCVHVASIIMNEETDHKKSKNEQ